MERTHRHGFAPDPRPFAAAEYAERLGRFKVRMAAEGLDALVITMPEHLNYLTGFDPFGTYLFSAAVLVPEEREPILITHRCEQGLAWSQCSMRDIRIWQHGEDPIAATAEALRDYGVPDQAAVGLEMSNWYLKPSDYEQLRRHYQHARFVDATDIGLEARVVKSAAEIALMRQAAAYSDVGFTAAVEHLRPGVTENELSAHALTAMATAGSEYPALPMIIGSGPRSALFHCSPTNRVVQPDDPVMLEITGVASRYNSNIVRTVVAGTATARLEQLRSIVHAAFWETFQMVKPGIATGELDRHSRQVRSEYRDYIPARAGFGMGLAYPPVWVGKPDLLEGDSYVLKPGMTFSLEPSIAQCQGTSVIYGYNILVTETGAEILHSTARDIFEVAS